MIGILHSLRIIIIISFPGFQCSLLVYIMDLLYLFIYLFVICLFILASFAPKYFIIVQLPFFTIAWVTVLVYTVGVHYFLDTCLRYLWNYFIYLLLALIPMYLLLYITCPTCGLSELFMEVFYHLLYILASSLPSACSIPQWKSYSPPSNNIRTDHPNG